MSVVIAYLVNGSQLAGWDWRACSFQAADQAHRVTLLPEA